MASSSRRSRSTSPSATATPSAEAARDKLIDFSVSRVAVVAPRPSVSAMRSAVSSGHLIWTKCTSAPPRCRRRDRGEHPLGDGVDLRETPRCSNGKAACGAADRQRAGRNRRLDFARLEHQKMRGEPALCAPDITRHAASASPSSRAPRSASCKARVAKPRVKSLTSRCPRSCRIRLRRFQRRSRRLSSPPRNRKHRRALSRECDERRRGASRQARDHGRRVPATAPNTPPCIVTILIAAS